VESDQDRSRFCDYHELVESDHDRSRFRDYHGIGPGPFDQITGDELLRAETVVAFAATKFRNPNAPLKTNTTKATTDSNFDMEPPSWETNPEALYAVLFHNETEMCCA
jgi:hypothetical protein